MQGRLSATGSAAEFFKALGSTHHGPAIELARVGTSIISIVGGCAKEGIVTNNKVPCGSRRVHGICDESLLLVDVSWV